jgi:hypothetical protein
MKKSLFTAAFMLLLTCCSFGQNQPDAQKLADEAMVLYQKKEFLQAAKKFSEIFAAKGDKGSNSDRYNAACCWALANEPDSAFYQLYRIANKGGYTNYENIITDTDFESLYADKR